MLKLHLFVITLLAGLSFSIGQDSRQKCILNDSLPCLLSCDVVCYEDSIYYFFYVEEHGINYFHHHPATYNAQAGIFEIHRSQDRRKDLYVFKPFDVVIDTVNLADVLELQITINTHVIDSTRNFSMSDIPILEFLLLPNLKAIHIHLNDYLRMNNAYLNVELSKWKNYNYLLEQNTLESFSVSMEDNYYDIDKGIDPATVSALFKFKKLKHLSIPMYLNRELIHFPNLELLQAFEIEYLFAHHAADLNALSHYKFYERPFTENYAQRTFFMNHLHCFPDTLNLDRIANYNQPYYNLDTLKIKLEESKSSGHFTMLISDLFSYAPYAGFTAKMTDTLWDGELKNGKMVGLWKINLDYAKHKIYYINFDRIGLDTIPENGYFRYYFANGTLGIEGKMKDGYKEGTWKFYNLEGKLASVKNYVHDRPRGFFIDYENTFESYFDIKVIRRYYVSDLEYYQIHEKAPGDFPSLFFESNDGSYAIYYDPETTALTEYEYGKITSTYSLGDKGFSKVLFEGFFQYLYPGSKMKDISYFEHYFKTHNEK